MKKEKIILEKLIISEEVKSSSSDNVYTVNIYNNCVSCNCPAGGSKQMCKHIIATVYNNSEKIQNEAPQLFDVLLNIFEIKNSKEVSQEEKKQLYEQVMFVDFDISNKAYKHKEVLDNTEKPAKEKINVEKEDISKKLAATKAAINNLSERQDNKKDNTENIPNNHKRCRRCRTDVENIKDTFCPVCGSYIKIAKSQIVFFLGSIIFLASMIVLPDSQDKTKETIINIVVLFGLFGFLACIVSIFMFIADAVKMYKIRKNSGYNKSLLQEIKENQKEINEKFKQDIENLKRQSAENQQIESSLTFTAEIQTNDNITSETAKDIISYKMQARHFSGVPFCNQHCRVSLALYDGTIYIEDLERHKGIHNIEVSAITNAQLQYNNAISYLVLQTQNSEYIFEAKEKEILKMVDTIKAVLNI